MSKTPLTLLERKLREQAKKLVRGGDDSCYMQVLDRLAKENRFLGSDQLRRMAQAERCAYSLGGAQMLPCLPASGCVYRIKIGQSVWSLHVSTSGPQLWLEDRPPAFFSDRSNRSDLGLFQVLLKASEMSRYQAGFPAHGWVVTRYGSYRQQTAEFFSDDDARSLSYHFGIPIGGSFRYGEQREFSELCFLKSPAFAALRAAIRSGAVALPDQTQWSCGLSPLWEHLIAMADHDFRDVERMADWYFKHASYEQIRNIGQVAHWGQVTESQQGWNGSSTPFVEYFRTAVRQRRAPKN
ncbi:hypothetical protein [Massilia sp. METH4]|uniref:hypothetical protein n=1 Tax=Massilia sp. METH4 TaxID=3123041 RepID=UPI0030D62104